MTGANGAQQRRSLRYIILAAHLAGQPETVKRIEMTLNDVEELVGETLPGNARFPSWWRNDDRKMHSRAWLTAGWEVVEMIGDESKVVFARRDDVRS
ncbi:MAG: hypothetical protein M3198_07835 [Actinomycetota bacterium]|nr:hypothetical protein [Actinomycetota bacterium]